MSNRRRGFWFSTPRMETCPRGPRFWISAWWPVAVGIVIIAMESTESFGSDNTSHPLRWLFQALFGPVSNARWEIIHHYIRKSGHFFGYGALGLVWLRAWWMSLQGSRFWVDFLLGLTGTALVASCDEWHQTFLPNRTGSPWDVLLDCCGTLVMLLIVYVFLRVYRPRLLVHGN